MEGVILLLVGLLLIVLFYLRKPGPTNTRNSRQRPAPPKVAAKGGARQTGTSVRVSHPQPKEQKHGSQGGEQRADTADMEYLRRLMDRAMFDELRAQLQRTAYDITSAGTEQEKREFTAFVAEFAKQDPLYRDVMSAVLPVVRDHPGILQSDLTKRLVLYNPEQVRYVLYYAHEIGHLFRVKKGRSYALYLEPITIDSGSSA